MSLHTRLLIGRLSVRFTRHYWKSPFSRAIAVAGSNCDVARKISLMLKLNPLVSEIRLWDLESPDRLKNDLNCVDSKAEVKSFFALNQLNNALCDADFVLFTTGFHEHYDLKNDSDRLFSNNAALTLEIAKACATHCPHANICVLTPPLNSMVPLIYETMRLLGALDSRKIFGITSYDVLRVKGIVARIKAIPSHLIDLPVVGGSSPCTMVPLLSQMKPAVECTAADYERVRTLAREPLTACPNAAIAFAAGKFIFSLLKAYTEGTDIVEYTYMANHGPEAAFFSTPRLFNVHIMAKELGLGVLTDYEQEIIENVSLILRNDIKKGKEYARSALH